MLASILAEDVFLRRYVGVQDKLVGDCVDFVSSCDLLGDFRETTVKGWEAGAPDWAAGFQRVVLWLVTLLLIFSLDIATPLLLDLPVNSFSLTFGWIVFASYGHLLGVFRSPLRFGYVGCRVYDRHDGLFPHSWVVVWISDQLDFWHCCSRLAGVKNALAMNFKMFWNLTVYSDGFSDVLDDVANWRILTFSIQVPELLNSIVIVLVVLTEASSNFWELFDLFHSLEVLWLPLDPETLPLKLADLVVRHWSKQPVGNCFFFNYSLVLDSLAVVFETDLVKTPLYGGRRHLSCLVVSTLFSQIFCWLPLRKMIDCL